MFKQFSIMTVCAVVVCFASRGAEEKGGGLLEKTAKPDACAQIVDALNELYYLEKADATEKMIAGFIGKNQKVVVTGTIAAKPNESIPFISVKSVEAYTPKMPPAPPPPVAPEKKEEPAPEVKKKNPKSNDD